MRNTLYKTYKRDERTSRESQPAHKQGANQCIIPKKEWDNPYLKLLHENGKTLMHKVKNPRQRWVTSTRMPIPPTKGTLAFHLNSFKTRTASEAQPSDKPLTIPKEGGHWYVHRGPFPWRLRRLTHFFRRLQKAYYRT
jgi:hypothetical protein